MSKARKYSERELAEAVEAGDRDAMHALYQRYAPMAAGVCRRYTSDRLAAAGHFDLYAAAGGRMDVTLSNKNSLSPDADGNNAGDLQWSVCAGAGVQYNAGRLGVYIEPSAGYYFKADGSRPTVYSDYPVVFQIETGIRISL